MARVYEPPDSDFDEDFREEYERKSDSDDEFYAYHPNEKITMLDNSIKSIRERTAHMIEARRTKPETNYIPPPVCKSLDYLRSQGVPERVIMVLTDPNTTSAQCLSISDKIYQAAPKHAIVSTSDNLNIIQRWVLDRREPRDVEPKEAFPSPVEIGLEYMQHAEIKPVKFAPEVYRRDIHKAFERLKELGVSDDDIDTLSDLDVMWFIFYRVMDRIQKDVSEKHLSREINDLLYLIREWRQEQKDREKDKEKAKHEAIPAAAQPVIAPPQSAFIGLRRPAALVAPRGLGTELDILKEIPPFVGLSKLMMDDAGPPPLLSSSLVRSEAMAGDDRPPLLSSNLAPYGSVNITSVHELYQPVFNNVLSPKLEAKPLTQEPTQEPSKPPAQEPNHAEILKQVLEKLIAVLDAHECPIKHDHSKDLVVASDGHIYDRLEIANWVQQKGAQATSPVTRGKISNVFYPAYTAIGTVESLQKIANFINKSLDPNYVVEPVIAAKKPPSRETRCEQLEQKAEGTLMIYHFASKRYITVPHIPSGTTSDLYDLYGHKMQFPEGSFKLACQGVVLNLGEPMSKYGIERDAVVVHLP